LFLGLDRLVIRRYSISVALANLLLATVALAGEEPPFTPSERAQVEQRATDMQKTCIAVGAEQRRETPWPDPTGGAMTTELQRFAEDVQTSYCDCVGDSIRHHLTPALQRRGSPEEFHEFLKTEVKECGAQAFKGAWPKTCQVMAKGLTANGLPSATATQLATDACACVKPHVDAVTGDNWGEILRQYQTDNANFQAHPEAALPSSPFSILSPLQACVLQAKRSLQKKHSERRQ
jgi:hypothetical protein